MADFLPSSEWRRRLADVPADARLTLETSKSGGLTGRWDGAALHSRYRPEDEAERLVDSADLEADRPVVVIGLGLGYHVRVLLERGFDVAVVEPNAALARAALEGPLADADFLLGIGSASDLLESPGLHAFADVLPQVLIHPPSARIAPEFTDAFVGGLSSATLAGKSLGIAIVGPMYGGSLPITGYLERAFRQLGHRTLLVDNSVAWPLYQSIDSSVKDRKAVRQLGGLVANTLNEWCYARVAEFDADIVIVMAQAPLNASFTQRLRAKGTVCAFWYVENWRHLTYWKDICRDYDYFFHIQPGEFEQRLTEAGCPHHAVVQTGCDPSIHRPLTLTPDEASELGCDISFAGAGYFNRVQMFLGLTDYQFKIWGVDWNVEELLPLVQRREQRFTPEDFARICAASKINLNLHSSASHNGVDPECDAINPRVYEIAACGGFQLCDPCKGLAQLFDLDSEIPAYRNLRELRERIDYYLAHPDERHACADRARKRALAEHTYEHRARQMLSLILAEHGPRIMQKGVRVQHTVEHVMAHAGADSELGRFLATIPGEAPFTQETVNQYIALRGRNLSYPEQVFAFLREMRQFNETLLAELEP